MSPSLIVANWKMHHTLDETLLFMARFKKDHPVLDQREVVICPPFTALYSLSIILSEMQDLKLGAQNCHWEESGAYTGEISPLFLQEMGCTHVILGHSERRQFFGETNESVNKKVLSLLKHGLIPIVCIGENKDERREGREKEVILTQLAEGLKSLDPYQLDKFVIAYEPVWAIGTGQNATPKDASAMHGVIRHWLEKNMNLHVAKETRLIYGGSVNPDNINDLMAAPDIDGVLVGGASLSVDSFLKIIQYRAPK